MASDLPTGTVSFLFTDIEGSTRLLDDLGASGYAAALGAHRRICRAAFARFGGVEVDTQGDAFFVAFASASGAVDAAEAVRDGLSGGPVRVRIGVHTGEPLVVDGGYVGLDVHRAARIAAAAHGGQVVISATTRSFLRDTVDVLDLGEHRFKDLGSPERVYQIGHDDHPPLRSLHNSTLPVPATAFIGRSADVAAVSELLAREGVRLVTLVGPGGTGKTRLAIQVAAETSERFPDGSWWVPLASLRDPELVRVAIGGALDVPLATDDWVEAMRARLSGGRALVVLDNAEHLLEAAGAVVSTILAAAPTVSWLVTSRERLRVAGEQTWPVPGLADADGEALFVARARQADPTFATTGAVRELCRRLDNLPLAIELAAARTGLFSVRGLLERIGKRLDLLKGDRDADPRHQTLRATIEWSYDLLADAEREALARLSVFAGGCSIDAAEAVTEADIDTIESLIDKSLARRRADPSGEPRIWMLETVRDFAAERLAEIGDTGAMRRRHADFYAELARGPDDRVIGRSYPDWVAQLAPDVDNFLLAFATYAADGDAGDLLRLAWCGEVVEFRGYDHLLYAWIAPALLAPDTDARDRANAFSQAGASAGTIGKTEASLELFRSAVVLLRELRDDWAVFNTLITLSGAELELGQLEAASVSLDEAATVAATLGGGRAHAVLQLGRSNLALGTEEWAAAADLARDGLEHRRDINDYLVSILACNLAVASIMLARSPEAVDAAEESLRASAAIGSAPRIAEALLLVAGAAALAAPDRAAELLGTSDGLQRTISLHADGTMRTLRAHIEAIIGVAPEPPTNVDAVAAIELGRSVIAELRAQT